jgi:hypothetical protein
LDKWEDTLKTASYNLDLVINDCTCTFISIFTKCNDFYGGKAKWEILKTQKCKDIKLTTSGNVLLKI